MEQQIEARIEEWLSGDYDEETKATIRQLKEAGNEKELIDAFYTDLSFGTGGLRGIIGVGTNRMNQYTVGRATQGLANYILQQGEKGKAQGVAIACDSRNFSEEFASVTAEIFSSNGIKTYLFSGIRPTPELSYAIRKLGCISGVVITASHNPKEYNGYKAYWNTGGQVIPPHDSSIIDEVRKVKMPEIKRGDRSRITMIDKEIDEPYLEAVKSVSVNPDIIKNYADLPIIYTPLHGTGYELVPASLNNYGFTNVCLVKEQAVPDGNFPTIATPNPEVPMAFELAIAMAKEKGAELILATDPDADRMGAAIRLGTGEYELLTGNQIGTILSYYIITSMKERGTLPENGYVVKTIVTTDIINKMGKDFGVDVMEPLTGFKWIADIIEQNEGKKEFLFGFEESYGYLSGTFVRDKDAIIASCLLAEVLAYAKSKGVTLVGYLNSIYDRYGYYYADQVSITKKGADGQAEIAKMMANLTEHPPIKIGGVNVEKRIDYKTGTVYDATGKKTGTVDLPSSSVLQFFLEDESKITVRPSGTEPKIKFYFEVTIADNRKSAKETAQEQIRMYKESLLADER